MSNGNDRNRRSVRGRNPFESDDSVSDISKQSKGVSFDLDAIAATRRAMLSGKPSQNESSKTRTAAVSRKERPPTTTKASGTQKGRSEPSRRIDCDVEAGDGRVLREKARAQRAIESSLDSEAERVARVRMHHIEDDENNESDGESSSSGSSSSGSDSDDSSYGSLDGKKVKRKVYIYTVLALVSLMLLGGIIALSVVLFSGKKGNNSSMPMLTTRQEGLNNIIKSIVDPELLKDTKSPQHRAHKWLLYEDSLGLAPTSGASRERVIQRYALATFFFATGGPTSWKTHSWMNKDECNNSWTGVGCTDDGIVHVLSLSKSM